METYIEIIGFIATILLCIAYIPPILKMFILKNTSHINTSMFKILLVASLLWIIVSIYKESISLITCNSITFLESLTVLLYVKLKKDKNGQNCKQC